MNASRNLHRFDHHERPESRRRRHSARKSANAAFDLKPSISRSTGNAQIWFSASARHLESNCFFSARLMATRLRLHRAVSAMRRAPVHTLRLHARNATPCNWASCEPRRRTGKELRMAQALRALVPSGENQNAFATPSRQSLRRLCASERAKELRIDGLAHRTHLET